jgi:hypothetical protein
MVPSPLEREEVEPYAMAATSLLSPLLLLINVLSSLSLFNKTLTTVTRKIEEIRNIKDQVQYRCDQALFAAVILGYNTTQRR